MSDEPQATDAQVAVTRPATSDECFQSAARVLRFAEGETNPTMFDQYTTLAERWMELGSMMGGSDG